ncbi:MAG: hypothetical protein AAF215_04215 [Cyanobacteria bacterium P01_A01_bin.123]
MPLRSISPLGYQFWILDWRFWIAEATSQGAFRPTIGSRRNAKA